MRWLLDLEVIPQDDQGLRLAWEHPWAAWVWVLLLVGAAFFAFRSYRRLAGPRPVRGALAVTRAVAIVLLLVIISGPMLELPRETVENDWVVILVDRSASMTIADAEGPGRRWSRDEQLRALIERNEPMWRQLAEKRHVVWMGFHAGAYDLPRPAGDALPPTASIAGELGEPHGRDTKLSAALQQALDRAAARPLSGIVVISDGRTDDPPSRAVLRRLKADAVPVFTVPLGSPEPLGDLAVRRVEAPRRAFVGDHVPVVVHLDRLGSAAREIGGTLTLIDDLTGETLDRIEIPPGADDRLTLTAEPRLAGEATWRVVVETDRPDLIPANNTRAFMIDLIDRPLRVLFVDGYPRWEYRYLKNLLIRERSIESSVMLLSADRDFAQEGNQPITRLPSSPEEFARFDVIIIGDVPGSFFSPDELGMIRDHVADRGAGLLWIGGERFTPSTYAGSVIADLLPMRGSLLLPPIGEPVNMVPTPLADRLGVLRLVAGGDAGWPRDLSDPAFGWSQLRYAQRIEPGRLKPAAEVLAETTVEFSGTRLPLVVHMRYGAGRVIYVATDEIWRWRYGRGERLPEQFWVQMIRMLGRESLAGSADQATLEVDPRRLETGQPLRIELRLLEAQLAATEQPAVTVVIEAKDGQSIADITLRRLDTAEVRYAATYLPEVTGQLRVKVDDPALTWLNLQVAVEVLTPDDELRRPETDHPLLESLATTTGGAVLAPSDLGDLPGLLPNRSVRTVNPLSERIWDTPLAFALVLLVLTAEWIGRKVLRLA